MPANAALEQLRDQYVRERAVWQRVTEFVSARLAELVQGLGVKPAEIVGRPKEIASLVRKAITKDRADISDFRDKAGVRVVVLYPHEVELVAKQVTAAFDCRKDEDKAATIARDALDYLGRHLDVVIDADEVPGADKIEGELWCEIQVHTLAQTLWAQTSHPLLYKAPIDLPPETGRSLMRLVALSEIVDDELVRARTAIMTQPGYDAAMIIDHLERLFFTMVGREYDAELSQLMVTFLLPLQESTDPRDVAGALDGFVARRRDHLEHVYRHHAEVTDDPFLFQPESLLIFELLDRDPDRLESRWDEMLPRRFLETLAATWGHPLQS